MSSVEVGHAGAALTETLSSWRAAAPRVSGDFGGDWASFSGFFRLSRTLIERLPAKPRRSEAEAAIASEVLATSRAARERFLHAHVEVVYASLTQNFSKFLRVDKLVAAAAEKFPGLVPSAAQLAAEAETLQGHKEGLEVDQGIFLANVLGHERAGNHLCHAMLLPRPETEQFLGRFMRDGKFDLGTARVDRRGNTVVVTSSNPRFMNAEDLTTMEKMEMAVDIAILDPKSSIAVLRGGVVQHPKYRGRRVLGSGINLTHLYQGRIPFIWFVQRELGFVHKFVRGVARPDVIPDDVHGTATEKPWLCALEGFAIGGHCQLLLTQDFIIAASDAYMTLPARKEGIIPGFSNMRLPRFTGDRLARQLIQYERRLECDSPEGRLICDEVVPQAEMDDAIERAVDRLSISGTVGAIANRRAFRVAQEPFDLFRRYAAVYAREQAYCHFSPALIANLEQYWNAQSRIG